MYNPVTESRPDLVDKSAEIKGIKETGSTAITAHIEHIDFANNVLFLKWLDGTTVPLEMKKNAHTHTKVSKGVRYLLTTLNP